MTLRIRQTNSRNEVTRLALSAPELLVAEQVTSRKRREDRIPQEAKAEGNASDKLTWGREIGR